MSEKLRAGVYVDHSNIKCGGDDAGWHVDYKKLSHFLAEEYDVVVRKFFTPSGKSINDPTVQVHSRKKRLHQSLGDTGWDLVTKHSKTLMEGGRKQGLKCNLDCELIVEAMKDHGQWDVFLLLSGDGDFAYLAEEMLRRGKKVCVFVWRRHAGVELWDLKEEHPGLSIKIIDSRRLSEQLKADPEPTRDRVDTAKPHSARKSSQSKHPKNERRRPSRTGRRARKANGNAGMPPRITSRPGSASRIEVNPGQKKEQKKSAQSGATQRARGWPGVHVVRTAADKD